MLSLTTTLRGLLHKQPVAALVSVPKAKLQEKTETIAIRFQGECGYMTFHTFLFRAACPNADRELLQTPALLVERAVDEKGRGQIYVEASAKQTICELPGSRAQLISIKNVLGIIYNSRDGNSKVYWREPRKIWGTASPRTYALLLNCKASIKPLFENSKDPSTSQASAVVA